jgi:hypothetical protein
MNLLMGLFGVILFAIGGTLVVFSSLVKSSLSLPIDIFIGFFLVGLGLLIILFDVITKTKSPS